MHRFFISVIILLFANRAYSQSIDSSIFLNDQFNQQDFKDISKDLGAAFSFTTNSGGSSLGSLWGLELGLVFGVTDASNISRIAEDYGGSSQDELSYIPSGGLIAGLALPFGIGLEANVIPELSVSDASLSNYALAARWEITDIIPLVGSFSPLKLAIRASYGESSFAYEDNTESADIDLANTELAAIAGFNLIFLEPYISLSHIRSSTDLVAQSSRNFLDATIDPIYRDARLKATKLTAGLLFKLTFMRLGLEYANFDTGVDRYTAKLSFKI